MRDSKSHVAVSSIGKIKTAYNTWSLGRPLQDHEVKKRSTGVEHYVVAVPLRMVGKCCHPG